MKSGEFYARMAALAERGMPFVLATVIGVEGSSPRAAGAKMLILADGSTEETVGGGVLERDVIADGVSCLASGDPCTRTYRLRTEGENALGSLCGGDVTVFFEPHVPQRVLLVLGAGHVAQKLCTCASFLDHKVVVLDPRADMVTRERMPEAAGLICGDPSRTAELCDIGEHTSVVIVSSSHEYDEQALRAVIDSPAAYIGMMGSASKVRTIFEGLRREGVADELLARVHAPIGLDIGAETPAELALCIMAEIIAEESGKLGDQRSAATKRRPAAEESAS